MPRKLQKQWKKQLNTYHLIKNAIRATTLPIPHNWHLKPEIQEIKNSLNITPPPTTYDPLEIQSWLDNIANIAKCAKVEARKITNAQTSQNCKKAIQKYKALLNKKPKTIHKRIFNHQNSTPLDGLIDKDGNLATHPEDIANVIHSTDQLLSPMIS